MTNFPGNNSVPSLNRTLAFDELYNFEFEARIEIMAFFWHGLVLVFFSLRSLTIYRCVCFY
jgi:hypothetical protein